MEKISWKEFEQKGNLLKDNEKYKIYDIPFDNWRLSMTQLHAKQSTTGHSHDDALEIYFFVEGQGKIQIDEETKEVKKDDIVMIPKGKFHKVFNESNKELVFICVFETYEGR